MSSLAYAGYVIALIGGILTVILSLLAIIGSPFLVFSATAALGALASGVVGLILGIICVIDAKHVSHLGWELYL